MPQIRPITALRDTTEISDLCHSKHEPIFITKNGYGDMVIMSMRMYEEKLYMLDIYSKLAEAESDIVAGRMKNAKESLKRVREKYDV